VIHSSTIDGAKFNSRGKERNDMDEYVEKRKIVQAVPVGSPRVVETERHNAVVHEQRGMSGGAVAALILAAVAVAILITMLIINNQQSDRDAELAQERAAAAQQAPVQQPQQAPVVVMPQSQPTTVPVPVPVPVPSAPATSAPSSAPSSTQIEIDVTSKMLDDPELRTHPIDVKVSGGVATLSGDVPTDQLKARAERLASRVKGVTSVTNNLVVKP